jgi:hypothetical protein
MIFLVLYYLIGFSYESLMANSDIASVLLVQYSIQSVPIIPTFQPTGYWSPRTRRGLLSR